MIENLQKITPEEQQQKKVWSLRLERYVEDNVLGEEAGNRLLAYLKDPNIKVDKEFKKKLMGALMDRQNLIVSLMKDKEIEFPEDSLDKTIEKLAEINLIFHHLKGYF